MLSVTGLLGRIVVPAAAGLAPATTPLVPHTAIPCSPLWPRPRRFRLLGFCGSFCGLDAPCCEPMAPRPDPWPASRFPAPADTLLLAWRDPPATTPVYGIICVTVPTAFVRPSRKTRRMSGRRYSGFLIKRNRTTALSPVLRCSFDMDTMVAVCRTLPT